MLRVRDARIRFSKAVTHPGSAPSQISTQGLERRGARNLGGRFRIPSLAWERRTEMRSKIGSKGVEFGRCRKAFS